MASANSIAREIRKRQKQEAHTAEQAAKEASQIVMAIFAERGIKPACKMIDRVVIQHPTAKNGDYWFADFAGRMRADESISGFGFHYWDRCPERPHHDTPGAEVVYLNEELEAVVRWWLSRYDANEKPTGQVWWTRGALERYCVSHPRPNDVVGVIEL